MVRDIKTSRSSSGKVEKRGSKSVYTLSRTHVFEASSLDELLNMYDEIERDRINTIKNIEALQEHVKNIDIEKLEISKLIDVAKRELGVE